MIIACSCRVAESLLPTARDCKQVSTGPCLAGSNVGDAGDRGGRRHASRMASPLAAGPPSQVGKPCTAHKETPTFAEMANIE
jgi:hypothetical protein